MWILLWNPLEMWMWNTHIRNNWRYESSFAQAFPVKAFKPSMMEQIE